MGRSLAVLLAALVWTTGVAPAPSVSGSADATIKVPGLAQPVEILRDRWGINHIYAQSERDLFFAQGYAAARDRLFQFELWRRQATGTMAEIFGRRELKRDLGARLHMFRGDMKAELTWYHPHGEEIITSFVRGANAYIAEAVKDPSTLPIEFRQLGIKPEPWTPAVVISRHNALVGNLTEEVRMAQALRMLGADRVKDLVYFQGGDPNLAADPAVDLSRINSSILELYNAFRAPFRPGAPATPEEEDDSTIKPEDIGSNNWVVSGKLTRSGFPMMMNDPHRAQAAPSLRYWVHLVAPGWNVIGAGEPVIPGVSIGHNDAGAWGLTIFGTDNEDLYVYDTNPQNANQYKYAGRWEDMRIVHDTIPVKGEAPAAVDLRYTRHGPVIAEDAAHHTAYALRAAWLEIGAAPYLASLRIDQATTWTQFVDACGYSRLPAENMVWADRRGNIGYQAVGIAPRRPNWSGLVPVPGDGRFEWNGYLAIKDLPHWTNPDSGFIVTANNYVVPPDYPFKDALHYIWTDPFRASRITEVLASGRQFAVADMARLQNDVVSIPARSLVPLLRDLTIADARVREARDQLTAWNSSLDPESVPAGIYEMWQRRLVVNVRDRLVPKEAQPFVGTLSMKRIIDWLYAPDGRFGDNPTAARDELLVRSLTEAVTELTRRFAADPRGWQWGQNGYHHALIRHPLAESVPADVRARLNVGPFPRGGDGFTINATGGADNQTSGGSFKIVADTENWDNSIGINNPGQSGDPDSPHYRDLFELWTRGRYFPALFTRQKVEGASEGRLLLEPDGNASDRAPRH